MKRIKIVFELIFIFILPLVLLACCFNVKKDYDVNGNEINRSLEFNNIFELSSSNNDYYIFSVCDDNYLNIELNNPKYINLYLGAISTEETTQFVSIELELVIFRPSINDYDYPIGELLLGFDGSNLRLDDFDFAYSMTLERLENIKFISSNECYYINLLNYANFLINTFYPDEDYILTAISMYFDYEGDDYINSCFIVDNISISNNAISKVINFLYNSLGIQQNYILQIIVIYTLLWLIMWFIWHLIYLPLDFLSQILIRRVDYAKD